MRLEITRRADLAVRALVELAAADRRMKSGELAGRLDATPGLVPHVLGPLVTAGWVRSDPGPAGGYRLQVPLDRLNVLEVVEAVEGPTDLGQCVVADRPCAAGGQTCALHVAWARARNELMAALQDLPLAELRPMGAA